jgi:hypothetical protein
MRWRCCDWSALSLGEPAPDAEFFAILKGVFETIVLDHTTATNFFCLSGRCATLRKEKVWVNTEAICLVLPCTLTTHRYVHAIFQF